MFLKCSCPQIWHILEIFGIDFPMRFLVVSLVSNYSRLPWWASMVQESALALTFWDLILRWSYVYLLYPGILLYCAIMCHYCCCMLLYHAQKWPWSSVLVDSQTLDAGNQAISAKSFMYSWSHRVLRDETNRSLKSTFCFKCFNTYYAPIRTYIIVYIRSYSYINIIHKGNGLKTEATVLEPAKETIKTWCRLKTMAISIMQHAICIKEDATIGSISCRSRTPSQYIYVLLRTGRSDPDKVWQKHSCKGSVGMQESIHWDSRLAWPCRYGMPEEWKTFLAAIRNTFLRLVSSRLLPDEGEIFVPTHLRVLFVSWHS